MTSAVNVLPVAHLAHFNDAHTIVDHVEFPLSTNSDAP